MYYKKSKGLFEKGENVGFTLSRSKIELFQQCPRCFYMETKMGLGRPSTPPYTLNSAVDSLLKNEFDILRKNGEKHELVKKYGIDAIPYVSDELPQWRGDVTAFVGALAHDEKSNITVNGLVDDIWVNPEGELIIVDYKSTSTTKEISLNDEYKQSYKRQIEVYQWIFRKLGYKVSNTGYFVFANAMKNLPKFDGKLEFEMSIVPYDGDDRWVNLTLLEIKSRLESDNIPEAAPDCDYCEYKKSSVIAVTKWKSSHK